MTDLMKETHVSHTESELLPDGMRWLGITPAMMREWAQTDDEDFLTAGMVLPYMTQRDARILEMRRFEHQVGLPLEPRQSEPISPPRLPMDEAQEAYNEEERDWLSRVAPDLVYDKDALLPQDRSKPQWVEDLEDAQNQRDGMAMLRLLTVDSDFPKGNRVHFRANAFQILGYPELTLFFRRIAAREFAERVRYQLLFLNDLWQYQKLREARDLSEELLRRPDIKREEVISVASVLMLSARLIVKSQDQEQEALVPYAQITRDALEPILWLDVSASGAILGLMTLGAVYNILGQRDDAISAYSAAIKLKPRDGEFYALRGLMQTDMQATLADYEKAIQLHAKNTIPYIVVAEHQIEHGNISRAKKLCKSAYVRAEGNPKIQALATGILAVAELVGNTRSLDEILEKFRSAVILDPQNSALQSNFEAAKEIVREITAQQKVAQMTGKIHSHKFHILGEQTQIISRMRLVLENSVTVEDNASDWALPAFGPNTKRTIAEVNRNMMRDAARSLAKAA